MDDTQKPSKGTAGKMKDILNTYMRSDDKREAQPQDPVVPASTSTDINNVHVHNEHDGASENRLNDEVSNAVNTLQKERDDLKEQLLRKHAEFENYRKRTEREKEQLSQYVSERVFSKLVELLDDLHAAIEAGRKSDDYSAMLSGVEMIYNKASKVYEEHGVRQLNVAESVPFNVDEHEALMHIPHPEIPEGLVVQQVQRGYKLHDKVIRHAKVITSAGNNAS